jgi:hypothetical protein
MKRVRGFDLGDQIMRSHSSDLAIDREPILHRITYSNAFAPQCQQLKRAA